MKNATLVLTFLSFAVLGHTSKLTQHKLAQSFNPSEDFNTDIQDAAEVADIEDDCEEDAEDQQTSLAQMGSEAAFPAQGCWKRAYGRGVGRPISTCPSGYQNVGGVCYSGCQAGYTAGAATCW